MRLHPPSTILVLMAACFAAMGAFQEPVDPTSSVECEVARDFIEATIDDGGWFQGDKPVLLTTEQMPSPPGSLKEFLLSDDALPSHRVNPLLPLYFEMEDREGEHLSDVCPEILDPFPRIQRRPTEFEPSSNEDGIFDVIFFGMSVPAVSKEKGLAVLRASVSYAELDGYGMEILMMKDKSGKWRVAYSNRSWVS